MKTAVYPGSFDPVTNGHLDIIRRTAKIFDRVLVSVLQNSTKKPVFSIAQRMEMIARVTSELENVEVVSFDGLLVDYLAKEGADVIIKGLRAISDFEYEFQMALVNSKLAPEIETLFMMTADQYSYISSSIVREVARYGGDISAFVPGEILEDVYNKLNTNGG